MLQRGEVADDHGGQRDDPYERLPASQMGAKAVMKTRIRIANAAALGPTDMKAGDRRRRALIHVRRPDLERRGGNLEAESDKHQRGGGADQHQEATRPVVSTRADLDQIGRSR